MQHYSDAASVPAGFYGPFHTGHVCFDGLRLLSRDRSADPHSPLQAGRFHLIQLDGWKIGFAPIWI